MAEGRVSWQASMRAGWAYRRAVWWRFLGHRMVRREFYAAAARALSQALQLQPDFTEAYLMRGVLRWRELDDAAQAITDFSTVLRLEPARAEVLFYRGMAHQAHGDYAAAAADLRAALDQAPQARWRNNARSQLAVIQSIADDLSPQLPGAADYPALLPDGN